MKRLFESLILCSLPFTMAGTINIGFPLKFYEVVFPFLIIISLPDIIRALRWRGPQAWVFKAMLVVFGCGLFSAFVGIVQYKMVGVGMAINVTRFPVEVASGLRVGYLGLCACCLIYFGGVSSLRPVEQLRCWSVGALLAASYAFLLNITDYMGHPLWLWGQYYNQYGMFGTVRQATFGEGNYAGAYFLLSFYAGLALYVLRREKLGLAAAAAAFAGLALSQSSTAYIAFMVSLLVCAGFLAVKGNGKGWAIAIVAVLAVCAFSIFEIEDLRVIVYDKMFGDGYVAYSRLDRLRFISAAWEMWKAHKIFGIGLGFYSSYFPLYVDDSIMGYVIQDGNVIVNNVYMEILSEGGLLMFIPFLIMLGRIGFLLYRSFVNSYYILIGAGYLGLLIILNAFPGFTLLFIWVYMGIGLRALTDPEMRGNGIRHPLHNRPGLAIRRGSGLAAHSHGHSR